VYSKVNYEYYNSPTIFIQESEPFYSLEWTRTWGGSQADEGGDIIIDESNNAYIIGITSSFGAGILDVVLIKYDSWGNQIWNQTWGESGYDYGLSGEVDGNDIYLVGNTDFSGSAHGLLVKFNSSGSQIWNRTWSNPGTSEFRGIAKDSDHNLYLIGSILNNETIYGALLLVKINSSSGTEVWHQIWDSSNNEFSGNIAVDSNNNIYLVGYTKIVGEFDFETLLIKYDSAGTQEWNRTWGGDRHHFGESVVVDDYNNVYIAGTQGFGGDFIDAFMVKYDSMGNCLWNQTWGVLADSETCSDILVDSENNSYLTGYFTESGFGTFKFLVKFDSSGNQLWNKTWDIQFQEYCLGIAADRNANLYLVGSTIYPYDIVLFKYGIDSDQDYLTDNLELNVYQTRVNDSDTDDDGILDGIEIYSYGTNPTNWDTDGDGYSDGWEVHNGYDPLNSFSSPTINILLGVLIAVIIIGITLLIYLKKFRVRKLTRYETH